MGTHLVGGFGFGVGVDARQQLVPAAPSNAEAVRCASCGSPHHQLCARLSVGDSLILRIRRNR